MLPVAGWSACCERFIRRLYTPHYHGMENVLPRVAGDMVGDVGDVRDDNRRGLLMCRGFRVAKTHTDFAMATRDDQELGRTPVCVVVDDIHKVLDKNHEEHMTCHS